MLRLLPVLVLGTASLTSAGLFSMVAGQTVQLGTAKVTLLRFTDSRCPPRAYCLMAGNVTANVMVTKGTITRTLKFFLPGQALNTPAGLLKLVAATRREEGKRQKLTFQLGQP